MGPSQPGGGMGGHGQAMGGMGAAMGVPPPHHGPGQRPPHPIRPMPHHPSAQHHSVPPVSVYLIFFAKKKKILVSPQNMYAIT